MALWSRASSWSSPARRCWVRPCAGLRRAANPRQGGLRAAGRIDFLVCVATLANSVWVLAVVLFIVTFLVLVLCLVAWWATVADVPPRAAARSAVRAAFE